MGFEYGKVNRSEIAAETTFESTVEFRLKTGTSQIRVLPPHVSTNVWFFKSKEHWVDGVGSVPCLRQQGLPCPVCEAGERLYAAGNESDVKAALELRPRESYYYNILVLNSPDGKTGPADGVKILRTGIKIFKALRNLDNDEPGGWGDMTNPETGFNVTITKTGSGRTDTEYNVTPVPNKNKTLADMLAAYNVSLDSLTLFNLEEFVASKTLSYDELKTRFENKQIAPGFPGGPRLSAPQVVGTVPAPELPEFPSEVFKNITLKGEVVPPPVIEEE